MPHTASCHRPPNHLLACPKCQANTEQGFEPEQQRCQQCAEHYFDLAGMPCWFDTGMRQQAVWQNLYANILERGEQNLAQSQAQLNSKIYLASTQARLQQLCQGNQAMLNALTTLLSEMGLSAVKHSEYANHDASHMLQYYELLLRDWAWSENANDPSTSTNTSTNTNAHSPTPSENQAALNRVRAALQATGKNLGDVWVMGAGAGRLSIDIHTQLQAQHTVALDANLVLISAAHRLITQQKTWQLPELNTRPQQGFAASHLWPLSYNKANTPASALNTWYAMAGNAWQPPLKAGSFDTIITPWFMDVNGREPAALIAQVQKYLKPGGLWLNTGPLLYSAGLDDTQKLSHEEITALLALAGFEVVYQNIEQSTYLNSPLNAQSRTEQIWTFAAIAPMSLAAVNLAPSHHATEPPAWIVLPHLAIPVNTVLNSHGNPVLEQLIEQVDGVNSLNTIAEQMRANLGPDKDALAVVRSAFVEYLLL